ncbi:hypothetical protein JHK82_022307 [Glycine max]|nr:hypothetical protein JHK82_022307 [Glycine max]
MLNWDDIRKMKYLWNVACEVIRLTPQAQGAFREAVEDFVFNGFSIPKDWKKKKNGGRNGNNKENEDTTTTVVLKVEMHCNK